jgi:putative ribosome maturation factor rimN
MVHVDLARAQQRRIKSHLKQGGIIAYPTESCFGLGVSPFCSRGIHRLLNLKKRSSHKGLIVITYCLRNCSVFIKNLPEKDWHYLYVHWPAAVTYLLPAKTTISPVLRGVGHQKIALRIPDHPLAQAIAKAAGGSLVSTSANRAGQQSCRTSRETARRFAGKILLIKGQIGHYSRSSHIIDLHSGKRYR